MSGLLDAVHGAEPGDRTVVVSERDRSVLPAAAMRPPVLACPIASPRRVRDPTVVAVTRTDARTANPSMPSENMAKNA